MTLKIKFSRIGVPLPIIIISLMIIFFSLSPLFAQTRPGEREEERQPLILKEITPMSTLIQEAEEFKGQIRAIRIRQVGEKTWCDALIHYVHAFRIESYIRVVSTDNEMMQALIAASFVNKNQIRGKAIKTDTPKGREWPDGDPDFYLINELIVGDTNTEIPGL